MEPITRNLKLNHPIGHAKKLFPPKRKTFYLLVSTSLSLLLSPAAFRCWQPRAHVRYTYTSPGWKEHHSVLSILRPWHIATDMDRDLIGWLDLPVSGGRAGMLGILRSHKLKKSEDGRCIGLDPSHRVLGSRNVGWREVQPNVPALYITIWYLGLPHR